MKSRMLTALCVPALLCAGLVSAQAQNAANTAEPTATAPAVKMEMQPAGKYTGQQAPDEWRSSKIVGLNVYNAKNEKIGDINDLILAGNGKAEHAIVGVGGFLGMNEKNVAIPFTELKFSRKDDGSIHIMFDSTKEALQGAPNYVFYQPKRG